MKFLTAVSALLFANAALGARFTDKRRARYDARSGVEVADRVGRSSPRLPIVRAEGAETNGTADVSYSSNWAGAVLIGTGFTKVTGTFVVPVPAEPSGGKSTTEYAASAWVGIDGDTAQNSILQTGVDFYVENGKTSYDAWYEWYPDYAYTFTGITISAGDTITVTYVLVYISLSSFLKLTFIVSLRRAQRPARRWSRTSPPARASRTPSPARPTPYRSSTPSGSSRTLRRAAASCPLLTSAP